MFDTQGTDDRVRVFLQTAHQETFLNVRLLFGQGNVSGLTKNGGEPDRLADGRSWFVGIHLLTVSGLGLEVRGKGLTIHESVASYDTNGRAVGEDVQKRGLCFKRVSLA